MSGIRDVWLYANNIIRSARQLINEKLKPLNLSSAEGNILLHLLTRGEGLRQDDIAEELNLSKPAVSRALDSLETKGYVRREKDQSDRRVSRIWLSPSARAVEGQLERIYDEVFTLAAQGLTPEQIDGAVGFFGQVSESLTRAHPGQPAPTTRKRGRRRSR